MCPATNREVDRVRAQLASVDFDFGHAGYLQGSDDQSGPSWERTIEQSVGGHRQSDGTIVVAAPVVIEAQEPRTAWTEPHRRQLGEQLRVVG